MVLKPQLHRALGKAATLTKQHQESVLVSFLTGTKTQRGHRGGTAKKREAGGEGAPGTTRYQPHKDGQGKCQKHPWRQASQLPETEVSSDLRVLKGKSRDPGALPTVETPTGTPPFAPGRGPRNQPKHRLCLAPGWTCISPDGHGHLTPPLAGKSPVAIDTLLFGSKISS